MKKIISVITVSMALASGGAFASDTAFKLGSAQLDAISGAGYTKAGGVAGIKYGRHGVEVYSSAYAKGQKSKSYSSQLAGCYEGYCGAVASSGSKAVSYGKYRSHKWGKGKY